MVGGRVSFLLSAAAPILLAAACGGGGGGSSCKAPPPIAGAWSGSVTDDQAGGGALAIDFTQGDCALGGVWQATFTAAEFDGSGTLTGSASETSVSFTLLSTVPSSCGYKATGQLGGGNEIAGSYSTVGTNCARSGSFDVLRQVTATPTPTATPRPTATPTP